MRVTIRFSDEDVFDANNAMFSQFLVLVAGAWVSSVSGETVLLDESTFKGEVFESGKNAFVSLTCCVGR